MAKASTLRTLSDDQLLDELDDAKKELFNMRFAFATGQLDNSAQMSATKRDIARIHTVLREREIAAAEMLADPEATRAAAPETDTQTGTEADGAETPVAADATAEDPAAAEGPATSQAATDQSTAE